MAGASIQKHWTSQRWATSTCGVPATVSRMYRASGGQTCRRCRGRSWDHFENVAWHWRRKSIGSAAMCWAQQTGAIVKLILILLIVLYAVLAFVGCLDRGRAVDGAAGR